MSTKLVLRTTAEVLTPASFARAAGRVAAADPVLAGVAARWGPPPFWRHPRGFAGLVHGILAQQVSLESAVAAFAKLERALGEVEPAAFASLTDAQLREIGFSRQKAGYARGVSDAIIAGGLDLVALSGAPDGEVRRVLLGLRGVGRWTADVYLLFALRRADAWPSGDLALAKAVQELYGLAALPSWDDLDAWAERWRPWRAVAARYLWHDYLSRRGRGRRPLTPLDTGGADGALRWSPGREGGGGVQPAGARSRIVSSAGQLIRTGRLVTPRPRDT